jgi:hypothetical protein
MSYYGCGIAPLSQKQVSRILNGHPVRVALGKAHQMALSAEHAKKLQRAGLKGKGITVMLDPYAIANNQHLRKAVGMRGRGETSEGLKQTAGDNAGRLMTGMTDRALKGIAGGQVSEDLKGTAGDNAGRLMTGMTDRALKGIAGNGLVGLARKMIGSGKQGKALKAAAAANTINLMTAAVDRGIKGIVGNGMSKQDLTKLIVNKNKVIAGLEREIFGGMVDMSSRGEQRREQEAYIAQHGGGKQGKALKAAAAQNVINLMTAAVDRGIKGIVGNGMKGRGKKSSPEKFREWTKAVGQVFLPLNRGAMGAAKRQLIEAGARAGEAYIENEVPGAQYQETAPTAGETRMEKRQSRAPAPRPPPRTPRPPAPRPPPRPRAPAPRYMDEEDESFEYVPTATAMPLVYEGQRMDLSDLPKPPTGFPKQRLYASGARKRAAMGRFVGGAFKNAGY